MLWPDILTFRKQNCALPLSSRVSVQQTLLSFQKCRAAVPRSLWSWHWGTRKLPEMFTHVNDSKASLSKDLQCSQHCTLPCVLGSADPPWFHIARRSEERELEFQWLASACLSCRVLVSVTMWLFPEAWRDLCACIPSWKLSNCSQSLKLGCFHVNWWISILGVKEFYYHD